MRSDASLVPTPMQHDATECNAYRKSASRVSPWGSKPRSKHKHAQGCTSETILAAGPGSRSDATKCNRMQRVWQDRSSRCHGSLRAAIRWSIHKRAQQCTSERYGEPPTRNSNATECDTMQHFSRFCSQEIGITHSVPVRASSAPAGHAAPVPPAGRQRSPTPRVRPFIDLPRRKRSSLNRH